MESEREREKNQREFREILTKFAITQSQAADLITKETYRTIKVRTVRTWLSDSTAISAKPCPLWAIMALKKATVNLALAIKDDVECNKHYI
jgi:hypothetical protein